MIYVPYKTAEQEQEQEQETYIIIIGDKAMNIVLTDILYFNKEDNSLHHINVFTDGRKTLTDSKAKKFVKDTLNTGDKFVEKSKKIVDVPVSDVLNTPLLTLLEDTDKNTPLHIYTEQETGKQD